MTDFQLTITNLKLVLKELPKVTTQDEFNMARFTDNMCDYKSTAEFHKHYDCDTIGCLVGSMPKIQLAIFQPKEKDENGFNSFSWKRYSSNRFPYLDDSDWNFLFSGTWQNCDNTLKGALKRIKFYIEFREEHGKDAEFHWDFPQFMEGWEVPIPNLSFNNMNITLSLYEISCANDGVVTRDTMENERPVYTLVISDEWEDLYEKFFYIDNTERNEDYELLKSRFPKFTYK